MPLRVFGGPDSRPHIKMTPLRIAQLLHAIIFTRKVTLLHNIVLAGVVASNFNLAGFGSKGAQKPQLYILWRAPLLPKQDIRNLLTIPVHEQLRHSLVLGRRGQVLFQCELFFGIHILSINMSISNETNIIIL